MLSSFSFQRKSLARPALFVLMATTVFPATACDSLFGTHKTVQVYPLIGPLREANTAQLIDEANRLAAVESIHGRVDIQFEDTSFAEAGIADKYRSADGTVTLQRPGKVYLIVQIPVIAKDVAQMTSDGQHFRVAVLVGDEKYRRFVKGTNNAVYSKLNADGSEGEPGRKKKARGEKETVSALSNLRPQHLTDALMVRAIRPDLRSSFLYSQSEFFQEEPDTRTGAKKSGRVVRGYYLLEELSQNDPGKAHLNRRFWFDRVGTIRLARLQTFDDRGLLVTDVSYSGERPFGENGRVRLPSHIVLTRPQDRYKLSVTYQTPESVVMDREYSPDAFVLENKWQLPEVDLDAGKDTRPTSP